MITKINFIFLFAIICFYTKSLFAVPAFPGHIIFKHPAPTMSIEWQDDWFNKTSSTTAPSWRLAPKTGRCFIFPSWLEHKVDINKTDKTRISIALNTSVVKKVDKDNR